MLTLQKAKVGKFYKILKLSEYSSDKIVRRLFDLGFTSNQDIRLVRKSLIGKTFLVELRGYTISLRSSVAQAIILQEERIGK